MSRPLRAQYATLVSDDGRLVIQDEGHMRTMTITNDAEAVVEHLHLHAALGTRRLYYIDSCGDPGELRHDGAGRFLGFACATAADLC